MKENQLTTKKVEAIIKAKQWGYHLDGKRLYLHGSPEFGTFSWVFRFVSPITGKVRDMGLGAERDYTLAQARARARDARHLVKDGTDPIEERHRRLAQARAEARSSMPFKQAAEAYITLYAPTWKNEKHRQQWPNTLRDYAFPRLGNLPVSMIDGAAISETLAPIWQTKVETAKRVKNRVEKVCQWVKNGMPLPQQGASKRVKHHKAIPVAGLPAFMAKLRARDSISAKALEFTILTAARTAEAIEATWAEIDLKAKVWTIPAGRMKASKEHEVPLSDRAVAILRKLPREGDHLFVGAKAGKPLSNMALLELLRGMEGNGYTVHGFRSAFRDWAGDQTAFAREVIEHALAHQLKDKAEASYRRSSALEKRRKLMEAWSSYCSAPTVTGNNVHRLRRA